MAVRFVGYSMICMYKVRHAISCDYISIFKPLQKFCQKKGKVKPIK